MRIGAIGCGNVGFNTLKAFHVRGHEVFGLDVAESAMARLARAFGERSVLCDPTGLECLDVVFICVPTDPVPGGRAANLSIMEDVVGRIAELEDRPRWRARPPVVVQRSTCPPGTAARLAARLRVTEYAVNPSFLAKATQWEDSDRPPRIAYAGPPRTIGLLDELYRDFPQVPRYVTDSYEAVELLKYVENTIDAVLISLWNEYLAFADALGIERSHFTEMMDALTRRDRFATTLRIPGGSFGRWCLPKDLAALLHAMAEESKVPPNVLRGAMATNEAVESLHGENPAAATELLRVHAGRVVATEAAHRSLLQE